MYNKDKLYSADCRAFHATSCDIFCSFLRKCVGDKKMKAERNSCSYRKNNFFTTARIYHTQVYLFSKQKVYNKDKHYSVDCRACCTASFCIFFFDKTYLEIKIRKAKYSHSFCGTCCHWIHFYKAYKYTRRSDQS